MGDIAQSVAAIRDTVGAILRIKRRKEVRVKKRKPASVTFEACFVGTAWCIVENRFFVTANHVFNAGQPRDPNDRFYLFATPQNGPVAYHIPIVGFPFEEPRIDMAIVEIAQIASHPAKFPAMPVTFSTRPDGTSVVTYGYPAPIIVNFSTDENGNWQRGNLFLKGHANTGIITGQYIDADDQLTIELSVGWHHGESGGPIAYTDPTSVFAIMQRYRSIKTPIGEVAGPHWGHSVSLMESKLREFGARII